jgi:hypothetical protein
MAKGQMRGNREQKKPKAKKTAAGPAVASSQPTKGFLAGSPPPTPKKKG